MRRRWLAACLLASLFLAGCAGGEEPPPSPPPTATTPEPPTPTSPTGNVTPTPGNQTPTPTPPTPAPAPPPKVLANVTFDFGTEGDPTGQSPRTRQSERVPEGYASLLVNVSLVRASPAPATLPVSGSVSSPVVHVLAPDGTEVVVVDAEGTSVSERVPAREGAWSMRFEGAGTMRAHVVLTAVA